MSVLPPTFNLPSNNPEPALVINGRTVIVADANPIVPVGAVATTKVNVVVVGTDATKKTPLGALVVAVDNAITISLPIANPCAAVVVTVIVTEVYVILVIAIVDAAGNDKLPTLAIPLTFIAPDTLALPVATI